MSTTKTLLRTRLRKDVLQAIEQIAAEQNRTVGNFIETELLQLAKRHGYVFGRVEHLNAPAQQHQAKNPNENLL